MENVKKVLDFMKYKKVCNYMAKCLHTHTHTCMHAHAHTLTRRDIDRKTDGQRHRQTDTHTHARTYTHACVRAHTHTQLYHACNFICAKSGSSYKTLKLWEIHNSVFMNVSIIVKFVKILFCE